MLGVERYEADDVLATLATWGRDAEIPVVVVSGDRDTFQLVEDPYVKVLYNRRGVSDYSLYDESGIFERTGIEARRYPMLAALRGDTSDNLPGVPGVGEKTAAKLFAEFADLDELYANLDTLTPKLRENLAAYEERARNNETGDAPGARRAARRHHRRPAPGRVEPGGGERLLRSLRDELDARAHGQAHERRPARRAGRRGRARRGPGASPPDGGVADEPAS